MSAVNVFLGDNGGSDLGKIHGSQQTFGTVDAVGHIWGEHLTYFRAELTAAAAEVVNGQAVHTALLLFPEMNMGIYHRTWFLS